MSGNITELMRWSQIPVEISNMRLNENKLYGNPNRTTTREAIYQADRSQAHRMYTRMSGFHGARIPMGTLEGNGGNRFAPVNYWGLQSLNPVTKTRPALSSMSVEETPQINQINGKIAEQERMNLNKQIFSMTQNNQYLPQQTPF
jgi:hypothetical protein